MLAVVGTLAVALLVSSGVYSKKGDAPPKFFVRKEKAEVGEFYEGADIEHTYTIRNNGIGELHIINVRPG